MVASNNLQTSYTIDLFMYVIIKFYDNVLTSMRQILNNGRRS